jgi:hypothetical protein
MNDLAQLWAEPPLDLDVQSERAGPLIADEQVRLLARGNRLAIRCDPAARHRGSTPGTDMIDYRIRCVAHPHPKCTFRWVRLTLDLSGTPRASITDLSPRDEVSDHPVKITTSYRGGLKFDIGMLPVHPEVTAEHATEQDVYFPRISVSGIDLNYALWDFMAAGSEPLKVDRPLRLLAAVPASTAEIPILLTLRAEITAHGVTGRIPLIGRQTKTIPLRTTA